MHELFFRRYRKSRNRKRKGKVRSIWIGRWRQTSQRSYFQKDRHGERSEVESHGCDGFGSARFARATHPRHSLFLGRDPTNAASKLGGIVRWRKIPRKSCKVLDRKSPLNKMLFLNKRRILTKFLITTILFCHFLRKYSQFLVLSWYWSAFNINF